MIENKDPIDWWCPRCKRRGMSQTRTDRDHCPTCKLSKEKAMERLKKRGKKDWELEEGE